MLARAVYEQGRLEEAAEVAELAEVLSAADDFETRAVWLGVRAKVLAARGDHDEAERMAAAGAELLRQTDSPVKQADALMDLAEVLTVAGKVRAAQVIVEESATLYTGKRNVVAAARARSVLEELARAAIATST